MTTFEKMKDVLTKSGQFKEEEIKTLFKDALVGRSRRWDSDDDEEQEEDEDEDEDEDELVSQVMLSSITRIQSFERAEDDGRCIKCEGWGCDACQHTGGY
jgi:hypothetical protein